MFISISASLIVVDFFLYLIKYQKYAFPNITSLDYKLSNKSWRKLDPQLLSIPKAPRQNILGLTSQDTTTTKRKIIVTIGDSYTYGDNVEDAYAYPAQMQKILNDLGYSVTIYNYGVSGFGTDHEYLFFKKHILPETTPDILIWNIHLSDLYDNIDFPVIDYKDKILYERDTLSNYLSLKTQFDLSPLPTFIKRSNAFNFFFARLKYLQAKDSNLYDSNYVKNSQEKLSKEIEDIIEIGKKKNFTLILALVPQQYFYINEKIDLLENNKKILVEVLEEYPNFFNIKEDFDILFKNKNYAVLADQNVSVSAITSDEEILKHVYLEERDPSSNEGWKHLNEFGNYLFANIMAKKLMKHSIN